MQRKTVSISLDVWNRIQELRSKEHIGWDQFFLESVDRFRSRNVSKEIRRTWVGKMKSKLYNDFLNEDRSAVILLLQNDVAKRLALMAQSQQISLERVIENFVVEAPVVEAPVVEAPVVEAPVVETPVVGAPVVESKPKKMDLNPEKKVIQKKKKKTRRPSGWKKKYQAWQIEAERWKWKPMESWIWPPGSVRVLEDTTEEIDKSISQRLRTLFIYHLEDKTDDNFFRPYILEFRVEKRLVPGAPERIDNDVFHAIVYQYPTFEELKIAFKHFKTKKEKIS